jgi:hypothetical protein
MTKQGVLWTRIDSALPSNPGEEPDADGAGEIGVAARVVDATDEAGKRDVLGGGGLAQGIPERGLEGNRCLVASDVERTFLRFHGARGSDTGRGCGQMFGCTLDEGCCDLVLVHLGPTLDTGRGDEMHRVAVSAHNAGFR